MYPGLDFDKEELTAVMRQNYDEIIEFILTPEFVSVYNELMSLPPPKRPAFVVSVLLEREELAKRGIVVPDGILIQTSAFGDRRPTLFVVKKFLPKKYHTAWENVNWTFNNWYKDEDVSRATEDAWRPPLPVALQNELISKELDLETVPAEFGVNFGAFEPAAKASAKLTQSTN
jgi:hypothetical protein